MNKTRIRLRKASKPKTISIFTLIGMLSFCVAPSKVQATSRPTFTCPQTTHTTPPGSQTHILPSICCGENRQHISVIEPRFPVERVDRTWLEKIKSAIRGTYGRQGRKVFSQLKRKLLQHLWLQIPLATKVDLHLTHADKSNPAFCMDVNDPYFFSIEERGVAESIPQLFVTVCSIQQNRFNALWPYTTNELIESYINSLPEADKARNIANICLNFNRYPGAIGSKSFPYITEKPLPFSDVLARSQLTGPHPTQDTFVALYDYTGPGYGSFNNPLRELRRHDTLGRTQPSRRGRPTPLQEYEWMLLTDDEELNGKLDKSGKYMYVSPIGLKAIQQAVLTVRLGQLLGRGNGSIKRLYELLTSDLLMPYFGVAYRQEDTKPCKIENQIIVDYGFHSTTRMPRSGQAGDRILVSHGGGKFVDSYSQNAFEEKEILFPAATFFRCRKSTGGLFFKEEYR